MGAQSVRSIAVLTDEQLESLQGTTVTVDAHAWLYKYMKIISRYNNEETYTTTEGTDLSGLVGCIQGLQRFFEYNITPYFIFDGSYHALKTEEVESRRQFRDISAEKQKQAEEQNDFISASKHESRSKSLTSDMITEIQTVLDYADISYQHGPIAGEAQAAVIQQESDDVYAVISDDYDAVLFGATQTVRNFTSPKDLERIDLQETLSSHSITQKQLVNAALLCETDYTDGIYGYGPKTSIKEVQEKSLETILLENDVPDEEQQRYYQAQELFLNPETTSYSVPTSRPQPNSEKIIDHLHTLNIPTGPIQKSIDTITEQSTQMGLDSF